MTPSSCLDSVVEPLEKDKGNTERASIAPMSVRCFQPTRASSTLKTEQSLLEKTRKPER